MKIETGKPPSDGRYVAFQQLNIKGLEEWVEPVIAAYHGGHWHWPYKILGWIGPLPVLKVSQIVTTQEFDL